MESERWARLKFRTRLTTLLTLVSALALCGEAVAANAGLPDTTFGAGGFTVIDEPGDQNEQLHDVAVLGDGKILGAGRRGTGSGFLLARLNPDGSPDAGFGSGGVAVEPDTKVAGAPREIDGIEVRADGKIVAAGLGRGASANAFAFARYLPGGTLDPSFGAGGLRTVEIAPAGGDADDIALAPDGKVVAVGSNGAGGKAVVVRLTENGDPDAGFGPGGGRFVDVPFSNTDVARAAVVLSNGTVLLAGSSTQGGFLAELDVNGAPVASFGFEGIRVHDLGDGPSPSGSIEDIELLGDGRILVAGRAFGAIDTASELVVARFMPDGELDPTFADGGVFRSNPTDGVDEATALELQPDGKIVVAGLRGDDGEAGGETWLLRFTPDGDLDPTFGSGGESVSAIAGLDWAQGLALQPDGKAVTAGAQQVNENFQLLFGRFTADEAPTPILQGPQPAGTRLRCAGKAATLTGTPKADRLVGTNRADVIVALGGRDRINAKGGKDLICSGAGKDVVKGGGGADRIIAGAGKDRMFGGAGRDICNGGAGKDVLAASCELPKRKP